MTRTARRAAVAALAALAAIAAIIAADFTAPASAQSDEQTGRIVARLLDDGRVEFGWQPSGAARVLPTKRYFPASIDHDRWLRSSPVEVAGSAIGRINARLLSDGRIEFAFTPTDRERITPQARYFPADARVGRWLRSTEITIGPARTGYIAVSAGGHVHTCAIRAGSGAIECWGLNGYYHEGDLIETGQTDAPEGRFTAVSAGSWHTCAIRESGEITCWGDNTLGQSDAPEGSYIAASAGTRHTCALRESGEIACWGADGFSLVVGYELNDAPDGRFTAISTYGVHTCAIRDTGEIECWGGNEWGDEWGQSDAPDGRFTAVSAGFSHPCAIRASGAIECWGLDSGNEMTDAPEGSFSAVSTGFSHTCAIRESGEIACWGFDGYGETDAPEGSYSAISAGGAYTCAIRASGALECWGRNEDGQATPPTD